MDWLYIPIAILFSLLGLGCLSLIVMGLPGVWVMLALASLIELCDGLYLSGDDPETFSWRLIGVCVIIGAIGEVVEFAASVVGTKIGGGTKRGMWGAFLGGIVGAIALTPVLVFIPVVGSLVGAIIGTFVGAFIGEISAEKGSVRGSLRPASGATIARVIATVAKIGVAVVVWVTLTIAAIV